MVTMLKAKNINKAISILLIMVIILTMFTVLQTPAEAFVLETAAAVTAGILILLAAVGITVTLAAGFTTADLMEYLKNKFDEYRAQNSILANTVWTCIERLIKYGKKSLTQNEVNAIDAYVELDKNTITGAPTISGYKAIRVEDGYYVYRATGTKTVTNPNNTALTMPFSDALVDYFRWSEKGIDVKLNYNTNDWTGSYCRSSAATMPFDCNYKVKVKVLVVDENINGTSAQVNYIKLNRDESSSTHSPYTKIGTSNRQNVVYSRIVMEGTKTSGQTVTPQFYFGSDRINGYTEFETEWELWVQKRTSGQPVPATPKPYEIVTPAVKTVVPATTKLEVKETVTQQTATTVVNNYIYNNEKPEVVVSLMPVDYYVQSYPSKMTYDEGEIFDITGIQVIGVYSDNTTEILEPADILYSPSIALTPEDTEIQIYYLGEQVGEFPITVNEVIATDGITSIEGIAMPETIGTDILPWHYVEELNEQAMPYYTMLGIIMTHMDNTVLLIICASVVALILFGIIKKLIG